jgi:hypothetical protein
MLALEAWAMVGIHVCGTDDMRRLLLQLLVGCCHSCLLVGADGPRGQGHGRQGRLFSDFIEYCNLCCAYVLARIL